MEKSFLEDRINQGVTFVRIAAEAGMTVGGVRYWVKRYGLHSLNDRGKISTLHKCSECGETDPGKFYGNRKSMCARCARLDTAFRIKRRKLKVVQEFGGKCERCGYDKCLAALEFHHKDPSKKDPSFRTMRAWSSKVKMDELKKCELLCANCHREEHWMKYEIALPLSSNGKTTVL